MKMSEKITYLIAIAGAIICFVGDNLLGYFVPSAEFGNMLLCVNFSYDWANVNPIRFVIAGLCGVVSLLMMFAGFYGIYSRIKKDKTMSKAYLLASFVFVSVGTLYHNVFAIAAYIYNRLVNGGIGNAEALTLEVFNTFILVSLLAALGYTAMVVIMFIEAVRGNLYPYKWMCIINLAFFMIICILLSKILPQTAFVNGVFDLGQQNVGLFIVFITLYLTNSYTRGTRKISKEDGAIRMKKDYEFGKVLSFTK